MTAAGEALAAQFRQVGFSASDAHNLATLVVCAVEGAVLMCRAERGIGPLEQITDLLVSSVA